MATLSLGRLGRGARWAAGMAAVAAPFAAHAAIVTGRFVPAALTLAAVQAAVLGALAWRQARGWRRPLGVLAAGGTVAWIVMRASGEGGLVAGSGLSHALIYGSLLLLFGQSLRPGRTALVTGLATRLRGSLTPAMRSYTRTVTKAWCIFFLAELVLSAVLLAAAPTAVWSLFVNVLDGPMVVALFGAEFAVRRWRFGAETHHSPLAVARSFARGRAGA